MMIVCPGCKGQFDISEKVCPHCGWAAKKPEPSKKKDIPKTEENKGIDPWERGQAEPIRMTAAHTKNGKKMSGNKYMPILLCIFGILLILVIAPFLYGKATLKDIDTKEPDLDNKTTVTNKTTEQIIEKESPKEQTSNIEPVKEEAPITDSPKEEAPIAQEPSQNDGFYPSAEEIDKAYIAATFLMNSSELEFYNIEKTDEGVVINIWSDKLSEGAYYAGEGDPTCYREWVGLIENMKTFDKTIETMLLESGVSNRNVQINLLNEKDKTLTLLTLVNGVTFYDYVKDALYNNGISADDLLN